MDDKTPERLALEARAIDLGVEFAATIGDKKLTERVDAAQAERDQNNPPEDGTQGAADDGSQPQVGAPEAPTTLKPAKKPATPNPSVPDEVDALVLDPLMHDGVLYQPDESVVLPVKVFARLEALRVVARSADIS
jgi:hypothetical protein